MKLRAPAHVFSWALCLLLSACRESPGLNPDEEFTARDQELRLGLRFLPPASFKVPSIEHLPIPAITGVDAVWGATGRDDSGRIYFGASTHGDTPPNAYLFRYDPGLRIVEPQGDVVAELKRAGFDQPGQGQNKLHSKIYEADDGYLYFSSFDERGESDHNLPSWGGHLWRKATDGEGWQHILATPEALIAVNTDGRAVYALGYWEHVLYRYDTASGVVTSTRVGAPPGHVSRNFLVDYRGHAFVPRVTDLGQGESEAILVEYDNTLSEVGSNPLPDYVYGDLRKTQGIVAYTPLRDERIAFIAGRGGLYLLSPRNGAAAELRYLGKMHPDGDASIKNLFTGDGLRFLFAAGRAEWRGAPWEWIIYELETQTPGALPMDENLGVAEPRFMQVYGSATKDDFGAFYVAGNAKLRGQQRTQPLLLRLTIPR